MNDINHENGLPHQNILSTESKITFGFAKASKAFGPHLIDPENDSNGQNITNVIGTKIKFICLLHLYPTVHTIGEPEQFT